MGRRFRRNVRNSRHASNVLPNSVKCDRRRTRRFVVRLRMDRPGRGARPTRAIPGGKRALAWTDLVEKCRCTATLTTINGRESERCRSRQKSVAQKARTREGRSVVRATKRSGSRSRYPLGARSSSFAIHRAVPAADLRRVIRRSVSRAIQRLERSLPNNAPP
jgi:hypothetical protein